MEFAKISNFQRSFMGKHFCVEVHQHNSSWSESDVWNIIYALPGRANYSTLL